MQYIQGHDRHQTYFITLDDHLAIDNPVRLIDAFVDKLDLEKLGFTATVPKSEGPRRIGAGRPPYAPQVLLKLYLYGYLNKVLLVSCATKADIKVSIIRSEYFISFFKSF
jgi:transposase